MTSESTTSTAEMHPGRLFVGSCMALVSTSVAFGAVTSLMTDFKNIFALSNEEAGWVGGAALWGFTISIFVFGPLVDAIGMRKLLRFSMLCHLVGPLLMIMASGFWMLFIGALVIALANGTVEAVCNPLVATIYPDRKTEKLNQFHVWFPGGIVIGGLAAFLIDKFGPDFWKGMFLDAWQAKLALVFVPTVLYGILFTGQRFPATERVQSGVSFGGMVKATFLRPLFIVLFFCMALTASLELGPNRWMSDVMSTVMEKIGGANAGILVLVYGSGLMALLRFFAGPVVHRLSPTGLLVVSAVLAGAGLFSLTHATGPLFIFIAATVFYMGVCYFWPTMLGVAAERVPKGGALALGLLGGWGMAVVGLVTVPVMGWISDHYGHQKIPFEETAACIREGTDLLPRIRDDQGGTPEHLDEAVALVRRVRDEIAAKGTLPEGDTAKALRTIVKFAGGEEVGRKAEALIRPADDYGGLVSFRWVASLSIILVVVFGFLYLRDRARGGYRVENIGAGVQE